MTETPNTQSSADDLVRNQLTAIDLDVELENIDYHNVLFWLARRSKKRANYDYFYGSDPIKFLDDREKLKNGVEHLKKGLELIAEYANGETIPEIPSQATETTRNDV